MSSDAGTERADAPSRGRPVWMWVLIAACAAVGVGLVVAVAGLFTAAPPQPPAPAPGTASAPPPTRDSELSAYRLSDPLPFSSAPVWHAAPSALYTLTAAPGEFRYVGSNGCTLVFRTGPLVPSPSPSARTTAAASPPAAGSPTPSGPPSSGSLSSGPSGSAGAAASDDPETAATAAALEGAAATVLASGTGGAVTGRGFPVVVTLGSLTGPLVDMAGATLRVEHADGTVTHVRLAVRAVPSAQASFQVSAECATPEEAATAMNHASVHAFIATR
ncbi:hypothetical protein [Sinomonas sp. R1AF57]|uniref:hypothetical protein n=1 Tax=Sinomonas sp. R1AF57 TaxID=2020377 RepID=UPI001ABF55B7|nr:hypothetical protein [Sinomonas sp. R1AF57]